MKITDCVWELANIGKKTAEISVDKNDILDETLLKDLDSQYEYQVMKVTSGNIAAIMLLEENGFRFVETQIAIELKYSDFDWSDSLIKFIEPDLVFVDVVTKNDFDSIFDQMTPDMFISDRVALDPYFGLDYSYKRYCNWMRTSFENKTASFFQMKYKDEFIGFSMFRIIGTVWHGDLGGVYPNSGKGLGLLTACAPFLYIKQRGLRITKLISAISSNNDPVLPTFNHCHYNFKKFIQVFVKHNDSI